MNFPWAWSRKVKFVSQYYNSNQLDKQEYRRNGIFVINSKLQNIATFNVNLICLSYLPIMHNIINEHPHLMCNLCLVWHLDGDH